MLDELVADGTFGAATEVTLRVGAATGERLALPETVDVPGRSAIRLDLYFARGAERATVELACAGTLVADDLWPLATYQEMLFIL